MQSRKRTADLLRELHALRRYVRILKTCLVAEEERSVGGDSFASLIVPTKRR